MEREPGALFMIWQNIPFTQASLSLEGHHRNSPLHQNRFAHDGGGRAIINIVFHAYWSDTPNYTF